MTELKLVVLAGAKQGTQIPLKKSKFIIGRASECNLRASSDAISRRHCAILRTKEGWVARDLGSRNGSFVNDQRIESPTSLSVGDELRVGPLKFRVETATESSSDSKATGTGKSSDSGKLKGKKPAKPQDTAKAPDKENKGSATEEDISRWLLGVMDPADVSMRETQTLSMDDTTTITPARPVASEADEAAEVLEIEEEEDLVVPDEVESDMTEAADENETAKGSGGWNFLSLKGKRGDKKKPGKLPKLPDQGSKDSREAAADILRGMTRRR